MEGTPPPPQSAPPPEPPPDSALPDPPAPDPLLQAPLPQVPPQQSAPAATASAAPVIEVRGLTKRYGALEVLKGLDLSVSSGEVYGFLGRNGAGKSTTIRILMGIQRETGGSVRMFGAALSSDVVRWRQRIGYVAQEQTFYGWMTPRSLGDFVRGFYPTWDRAEFARLLRAMELPEARKVETFSGGMRAKLALSLALAHRPPLLLLDEPTAGLDPVARREFLETVRDESERSGRTTFFSSHLIDEVEIVAKRVCIVDAGRARYEGEVAALAERVRLLRRPLSEVEDGLAEELRAVGLTVLRTEQREGVASFFLEAADPRAFDALAITRPALRIERLPLEEIFLALVRRN